MVLRHSSIAEAYGVLGLAQDASLDSVKSAYKQLALRTHPDKNPNNPDATLQFQQVGEAYHLLLKHLDTSSPPPTGFHPFHAHAHAHHSHSHYQFYDDDEDSDLEEYYDGEEEYYEEEENLDFFMFLFEELLNGRANRYAGARFQARGRDRDTETEEQYAARVQRQREEQAAAERRRKEQEEAWKVRRQMEREIEARAGAERRKQKAENKKAEADAARKAAAQKVRDQQQKAQTLRSAVFAAARHGGADEVRKGVWEDGVDAAGGEVAPGMDEFVQPKPKDPQQTLLHIATMRGDVALVEWLDRHNAEPEERDRHGRTAFHLALEHGHIPIVRYFLGAYPPADEDSAAILHADPQHTPLLQLALASGEPEIVWLVLDAGLAEGAAVRDAWTWVRQHEAEARRAFGAVGKRGQTCNAEKFEETKELLMSWGGFTPPPTPPVEVPPPPPPRSKKDRTSKKPSRRQMPTPPESPPTPDSTPPSSQDSPPNSPFTHQHPHRPFGPGRGRGGRGRGRGRGRGHGRGRAAPLSA